MITLIPRPHQLCVWLAIAILSVNDVDARGRLFKRDEEKHDGGFVAQAILIPILVILSGILAGLTLGYMSLDETQLRVLSVSGTTQQKKYAQRIQPIRKNGHLLLTTLLLGNMVVNETLPVISENVLGGGIQAVVVSTVLIVVFSEIIPQSLCSRFGLQIGAYMAVPTRILIYCLFVVAWPIAKLLEFALGPHHGIVYRRNELKELINMHSAMDNHGGDLQSDTVTMVGGALDFQEKTVRDAMTSIKDVFMLPIDSVLDYDTLARVVRSGHSRVPVFEETKQGNGSVTQNIIGILLVKQCVLLDPEDATPLRDIPLNTVPTVPFDEPLLRTLDRFQQGNSHMAVVSRIPSRVESKAKPGSVNEEAQVGMTRRFLNRVGLGDDSNSSGSSSSDDSDDGEDVKKSPGGGGSPKRSKTPKSPKQKKSKKVEPESTKMTAPSTWMNWDRSSALEQTMPSDAILPTQNAQEFFEGMQRAPLGIITLEDVLEELIGEEILDEFDLKGAEALPASSYVPEEAQRAVDAASRARLAALTKTMPNVAPTTNEKSEGGGVAASSNTAGGRVAQGLRAIRLKTAVAGAAAAAAAASKTPAVPTAKRSATIGGPVLGGGSLTTIVSGVTAVAEPSPDPTPPLSVVPESKPTTDATGGRSGSAAPGATVTERQAPPNALGISNLPLPMADTIPVSRGGSKNGKKRAFKSLIAGEGATPGLEKRADPFAASAEAKKNAATAGGSGGAANPAVSALRMTSVSGSSSAPDLVGGGNADEGLRETKPNEDDKVE